MTLKPEAAAALLLLLGGMISLFNFYLSWLRPFLHRLLRPDEPFRWVSGIPLVGSCLLLPSFLIYLRERDPLPVVLILILTVCDTGGGVWLFWTLLREARETKRLR